MRLFRSNVRSHGSHLYGCKACDLRCACSRGEARVQSVDVEAQVHRPAAHLSPDLGHQGGEGFEPTLFHLHHTETLLHASEYGGYCHARLLWPMAPVFRCSFSRPQTLLMWLSLVYSGDPLRSISSIFFLQYLLLSSAHHPSSLTHFHLP